MSPPIIHLGAVTYANNHTPYAVRAEVSFDFRHAANLISLRLSPLTQPESPDFVPSAIDLFLFGRWQTALSPVRKRHFLEIQNASVKRSDDADINPVRLELVDPPPSNVAVYLLANDMTPTRSVTAATLDHGLLPCSQAALASFQGRSAPWAAPARQSFSHTRVTIADTPRNYEYAPIGTLSNPEGPISYDPMKKFNVFGVIVECRAPSIAKTGTLRSEIVVADESSVVGIQPGDPLKSIAVFTFEANPDNAIPFRAIGDVVRVHRVHLKEFNVHSTGERRRSAMAKFYSSMLFWAYEGKDFLPFTSLPKQQSSQHRISVQDRNRVRQLRKWAKDYIFQYHKIPRPKLRTPYEIIRARTGTPWLSDPQIDVLCVVEKDAHSSVNHGILSFNATEGFPRGNQSTGITVLSESLQHCDHQYNNCTFIQFCPSWQLRPTGRPAWVVLRDVSVATLSGERVIMLHAGQRTSSIIWNAEGSPDYRNIKSKFGALEMAPHPSSTINPESVNQGYGYGHAGNTGPAPSRTEQHCEPQANQSRHVPSSHVRQSSGPQANGGHLESSRGHRESPPRSPPKRQRRERSVRSLSSPYKQNSNSTPLDRREPESANKVSAQPPDEVTMRSLPLRRELIVITANEHNDKPFSSIAGMLKVLRDGNKGAHRLRVTARACSTPKDVRFACRPWCNRCNKYLKIDANHAQLECLTCGDTFSSTRDPKTTWAYSVKLVLEDSAGGRIDGWIEGKEGSTFFSGLNATNLLNNPDARRRVSKTLQVVLSSKNILDCSVKPYEYEDEQGFYRVACKIFATKLLPLYIATENKD